MIDFSVSEAAKILHGEAVNGDVRFNSVSTDSRTLDGEALFTAIPGEHYDGHDYVARAAGQGAVAALVFLRGCVTRRACTPSCAHFCFSKREGVCTG